MRSRESLITQSGSQEFTCKFNPPFRKKMATGTFTYNALRAKTLKESIKAERQIVSH